MAAIHIYRHLKGAEPIDELCPSCFKPSLMLYILERIDWDGITVVATRIRCRDEQQWVSAPKECTP